MTSLEELPPDRLCVFFEIDPEGCDERLIYTEAGPVCRRRNR